MHVRPHVKCAHWICISLIARAWSYALNVRTYMYISASIDLKCFYWMVEVLLLDVMSRGWLIPYIKVFHEWEMNGSDLQYMKVFHKNEREREMNGSYSQYFEYKPFILFSWNTFMYSNIFLMSILIRFFFPIGWLSARRSILLALFMTN